jgi:glutamate-ammonia-ligase adenylyltransferase
MTQDLKQKNLASEKLTPKEIKELLASVDFINPDAAYLSVKRLLSRVQLKNIFNNLIPALVLQLANVARPDQALINLEHFIDRIKSKKQFLQLLTKERHLLEILIVLFAGSQFLTEIILNDSQNLDQITNRKKLSQPKEIDQLYSEALAAMSCCESLKNKLSVLRRFQKREFLRIGACDLFGLLDLQNITAQLSFLAECIIKICFDLIVHDMNIANKRFAVIALGKLGGGELNYSSDIDLFFIADLNDIKYQRLGQNLIKALTEVSAEGFFYRVDMRLRPWGNVGALVPGIDETIGYFQKHARLWEKQAMLKARIITGDEQLGQHFLCAIKSLLFHLPAEQLRKKVHQMKSKIESNLKQKGRYWGEVKAGEGSIRDIEFVTQYLQLVHGARYPEVCSINTLYALARLNTAGILSARDYRVMTDGYIFLRSVEHYLQIMHYHQTHVLPKEKRELNYLAKRLAFQGNDVGEQLVQRYEQHRKAIREIYLYYLDNVPRENTEQIAFNLDSAQHITRMDQSYHLTFQDQEIKRHAELAKALSNDNLVEIEAQPLRSGEWRLTVVAFDYLGVLSIICGLLFDYGFNIIDGYIFTYEAEKENLKSDRPEFRRRLRKQSNRSDPRRKLVDVFTVKSVKKSVREDIWNDYTADLSWLLQCLKKRQNKLAQGEIANRVAHAIKEYTGSKEVLLSVDIEIDNSASEKYTVLRIDAPDTIGFLFEFTNALALNNIYIARVIVRSLGVRVHDTLFVTDSHGNKIENPEKQHQLRAATVLVKQFTHLLPRSPNPQSAMFHFRELISQLFTQPDWKKGLASLERPEVLAALAKLLGVSDFLWDDFLRMQYKNLFPILINVESLKISKTKGQLKAELDSLLKDSKGGDLSKIELINQFKDKEMFRIDMRYIQGMFVDFWSFFTELSDLAEVVVESVFLMVQEQLTALFGLPRLKDNSPCKLSICALGKLGGREIGLASDIELIFIYQDQGKTDGGKVIANSEFYNKLVNNLVKSIKAKHEGIFKIDLRLRPYGKAGSLAVPLDSFQKYYVPAGPAWEYERQALVKLRPIAADSEFGKEICKLRDHMIYTGESLDITSMHAMRERQIRQLVAGGMINAKFSSGGLVDLEYLIQGLQITYGKENQGLRVTNTREAMAVLKELNLITKSDYEKLSAAHIFLRKLIQALRIVRGNAKDLTVPEVGSNEFTFLAKRLDYEQADKMQEDLIMHMSSVNEISKRILI